MKEKIYTIPVNEGFEQGGECPFCNMYKQLETDAVNYMLGPSYMEDDIRMETNKMGFCKNHYKHIFAQQNRLGVGLMIHTHIQTINRDMEKFCSNFKPDKKGLFKKPQNNPIVDYINNISNSCYICNKISVTLSRYFDTFFYMWKNMPEIRQSVKDCKGFCLEHFALLLQEGEKNLSAKDFQEFIDVIIPIQQENFKRLEGEVEWFTDKFDYRNKDKDWGTSRDALPRAITKLSSEFVEE